MVCGLTWLHNHIPKRHAFKRDWITCSKYDYFTRLDNQHNKGGGTRKLYNLLMSTRTVTLINDTIFIRALKIQPLEGRVFVVDGMRGMHTFIQR